MDSEQIFIIVAIVVAFSSAMIAIPVMAQMADNASMGNLTIGNNTLGNMTGGNVTAGNTTGGNTTGSISSLLV